MGKLSRKQLEVAARALGSLGGKATRKRHGADFFKRIGSLGGSTTKERHGHEHYERIGALGGQKLKRLIAAGRRQEAAKKEGN